MVTSRQTKKNLKPLPAGKQGKSRKAATLRRHRANEGKSAHEAERVRAMSALRTLKSKKKKAAEAMKLKGMSEDARRKWIDDYVERETEVARRRVEAADAAVKEDMERQYATSAQMPPAANPKKTFEELLALVGDDIDNVVPSDDDDDEEEDEELDSDEDEDIHDGSLDEDGFVPGQINKTTMAEITAARARTSRMFELTKEGYAEAEAFWRKRDQEVGVDTLKHSLLPVASREKESDDERDDVETPSQPRIEAGTSKRDAVSPPVDQREAEAPVRKRSKLVCNPTDGVATC
jgi:hypothetical protein